MSTRVAINGLGRIGRAILKLVLDESTFELIAVTISSAPTSRHARSRSPRLCYVSSRPRSFDGAHGTASLAFRCFMLSY